MTKKDLQNICSNYKILNRGENRMRYFFVKPLKVDSPKAVITGSDARHIKTVLRLKTGDKIGLFDGSGLEYEAIITALTTGRVEAAVIRRLLPIAEPPIQIIVAQGLLKDRKMDALIRHLTELGITQWIPFVAERSVPRPDKKNLLTRTARWKKIVKEAAKQCRRSRVPNISEVVSFEKVLEMGQPCDLKFAFWENEFNPINAALTEPNRPFNINTIFAMLGPEGGFTAKEIETAKAKGFISAALGPRILRAETATIAACVLLQYLFGDMSQKTLDIK